MNNKEHIKIIISINVHEKVDFLLKQIEHINNFVEDNYIIILNCNLYMYEELNKIIFTDNIKNKIIINPNILEKRTYHGSLLKGIILNLEYAINNYYFNYFLILSSINLFYNKLNKEKIDFIYENKLISGHHKETINLNEWHWHSFKLTKLFNNFEFDKLSSSAHEGLCIDYNASQLLISFLNNNIETANDLYNHNHCVEEFAIQTIVVNLYKGYIYLGNGCYTQYNISNLSNELFLYKTIRELNYLLENVVVEENKLENVVVEENKLENVVVEENKLENVVVEENKLENVVVENKNNNNFLFTKRKNINYIKNINKRIIRKNMNNILFR